MTQADVAAFVAGLLGYELGFENYTAIGFGEPLVAGFVYNNWNPQGGVIEISAAAANHRWMTKGRLRAVFSYPFDELGCQMVVARHAENNTRVRRIWKALGAQEYIIPRMRGRDEAEAIATLTVEAWREFEGKM